jgi:hypothetical protein
VPGAITRTEMAVTIGLFTGQLSLVARHSARRHIVIPDLALTIVVLVLDGLAVRRAAVATYLITVVASFAGILHTIATADELDMDAAGICVAAIRGAGIAVITVQSGATNAGASSTGITGGARIAIVTARGVVGVDTAGFSTAAVIGADVAVVTIRWCTADTFATSTHVESRAGIAVITVHCVVDELAPYPRNASVSGAKVAIVAR